MPEPEKEVVFADPKDQRAALNLLVKVLAAAVGAVVVLSVARQPVLDWAVREPEAAWWRLGLVFVFLGVLMSSPVFAAAALAWKFASETLTARRFPPPGAWALRDTVVAAGEESVPYGRLLQAVAAMAAVCGAGVWAMAWVVYRVVASR